MAEAVFKCNTCKDNKTCTSIGAAEHKEKTGHNSFRMMKKDIVGKPDIHGDLEDGAHFNLTPEWLKEWEVEQE